MRRSTLARFLIPIATVTSVGLAAADGSAEAEPLDRPPGVDEALWRRLKRVDRRAGRIDSFAAAFEQEKHTALLEDPVVSRGRVRMKEGRLRWDTKAPRPTTMLLTDSTLRIHYPKQRLLEVYPAKQRFSGFFASPVPRLGRLLESFRIEADRSEVDGGEEGPPNASIVLRLTPRREKVREHVRRVDVWLDPRRACATRVRMKAPDGERTVIVFRKIRINPELSDDVLRLEVPEDTRVTHPYRKGRGD